jgi:hypothetical protein
MQRDACAHCDPAQNMRVGVGRLPDGHAGRVSLARLGDAGNKLSALHGVTSPQAGDGYI